MPLESRIHQHTPCDQARAAAGLATQAQGPAAPAERAARRRPVEAARAQGSLA